MANECWAAGGTDTASSGSNLGIILGTCLVIAACFVSTTGVNLQKLAHTRNQQCPPHLRQNYAKLFTWQLGMFCMIAASVMDLAALPYVPQSRIAVLGSVTLIANVIITPMFLGEKLTRYDILGCFITMCGCGSATYFGASTEPDLTPACMMEHASQTKFLVYFAFVLLFLGVLGYFIKGHLLHKAMVKAVEANTLTLHRSQSMGNTAGEALVAGTNPANGYDDAHRMSDSPGACRDGLIAAVEADEHDAEMLSRDKLMPFVYISRKAYPKFYPIVYTAFAGTAGAQSIMFAKASLEMLVSAAKGQSSGWWLLTCLPPFGLCLWAQVNYLNQALKLFDALFVVPVYQSFWIVMGILSGLIFYQEYRNFTEERTIGFILGCAINFVGVYVLAQRKVFARLDTDDSVPSSPISLSENDLDSTLLDDGLAYQPTN